MAYAGTSILSDGRFSNKEKKLLKSRKWPPEFDLRVDMSKVSPSQLFSILFVNFLDSAVDRDERHGEMDRGEN